jgi:hypothetical protein
MSMKRLVWVIPAVLLIFIPKAQAQDTPAWEFSGGYSYLDANINGSNGTHIDLRGGGGTTTENLNSWFGGRVEFNGYTGNETVLLSGVPSVRSVSAETITYGPVVSYRRIPRVTPFGHVQLGVIHGSMYYQDISQSAYKFAIAPGGGVDVVLNQRAAIRVEGEYLISHFLGLNQSNISGSVGIVVRFGHINR